MTNHPHFYLQLTLYLDEELDQGEIEAIEAHLKQCRSCREYFNRERRFRGSIGRTADLYVAPENLRSKVTAMLKSDAQNNAAEKRQGLSAWLYAGFAATIAAVVVAGVLLGTLRVDTAQAATLADIAVETHQRHAAGRLPLELISNSPGEISTWFDDKVPFTLRLPNYQDSSGHDKVYRLTGARLIGFREDYAAYVRYEMGEHPISLVVTSSAITEPEGGELFTSGGLVIHYKTMSDLKVLTWKHLGLTYALVSDLEEHGEQSCMVCHQGMKDQPVIGELDYPRVQALSSR